MDKDTIMKLAMGAGATVIGMALYEMFVRPMLVRRSATSA